MKKQIVSAGVALGLAGAMALSLTGCGGGSAANLSAAEMLAQVEENMGDTTDASITMDVRMDMTNRMTDEESRMQMSVAIDMDMKQSPFQMYMAADAAVDVTGATAENNRAEIYIVPDGNQYMGYMGESDSTGKMAWSKQAISANDLAELQTKFQSSSDTASQTKLYDLMEKSGNLRITGQEQVNGKTTTEIVGMIPFADIMEAMETTGTDDLMNGMTDLPEEMEGVFDDLTMPIQFYVDEGSMTLVKCTADMTSTMKELFREMIRAYLPDSSTPVDDETLDALIPVAINAAEVSISINAIGDDVQPIQVPQTVINQAVESNDNSLEMPSFSNGLTTA